MRVLIVEDEQKLARLIRKGLGERGLAVDVAATGEDALWMAGSTAYDAIVLDEPRPAQLASADLVLDPATRTVRRGEQEIELSRIEFSMLETFMRRPGVVLSRLELLEHVWDDGYENRSNVVDVYVRYLRAKIDEPFEANEFAIEYGGTDHKALRRCIRDELR